MVLSSVDDPIIKKKNYFQYFQVKTQNDSSPKSISQGFQSLLSLFSKYCHAF
jgi:hypothetical protein